MKIIKPLSLMLGALLLSACGPSDPADSATEGRDAAAVELTVYSSRNEHLIKPLFDRYTAATGVKIRYITDQAGPLLARMEAEGENSPADLLLTVDAGNLWQATEKDLLQAYDPELFVASVPEHLRDPQHRWTGLSIRARTLVYSTERVQASELSTYEALADEQWRGRLCLRTSKKVYNQSLVASMIAALGEERTEQVVSGWVANLAVPPASNDTKVMEAIVAGQCDVSIVNTYYFGRMQSKDPAIKLALFWPNQEGRGVHINISGGGIAKHSKQPEESAKLLAWLASVEAQAEFASLNMEYPVNPVVKPDPLVRAWGEFKADQLNVTKLGQLQVAAIKLMDRAGYR